MNRFRNLIAVAALTGIPPAYANEASCTFETQTLWAGATQTLFKRQVAEYTETESVETVKGWCFNPESTRYRNMPPSKLKLLKLELAMRKNNR